MAEWEDKTPQCGIQNYNSNSIKINSFTHKPVPSLLLPTPFPIYSLAECSREDSLCQWALATLSKYSFS